MYPAAVGFSLRRRLALALAIALALVALVLWELVRIVRVSAEQRTQFTHSILNQELERVAIATDDRDRPTLLGLRYGIAARRGEQALERSLPQAVDAVLRAQIATVGTGERRLVQVPLNDSLMADSREKITYWVGALGRDDGSAAWVAYPMRPQPFLDRFRRLGIGLAVLMLALALLTSFTVASLDRGARSLSHALARLDDDLRADVPTPKLAELCQVADGIRRLAANLALATEAREALTRELQRGERLAALGRVVAGVAHEVRNPLAALKLRIDLAKSDSDHALHEDLDAMAREVERLDRLVSDLLVLGGRRPRTRSEEDLHALAASRAHLLEPWARERGVNLAVAEAPPGARTRSVDRDGLSQALDNLLRNAIEAAPVDSTVRVSTELAADRLWIHVEDMGSGVPEDRIAELFEPFFTTKPEGLGLGLATARALVVVDGGELHYARVEQRTRFSLAL